MFSLFKKKFDPSLLKPSGGVIAGMFFSNPNVEISTNLYYEIQIGLQPFTFNGEEEQTEIQLDLISLPVKNYMDLSNQSFNFPINPKEGYIDGSVYIAGNHNPFDVTQISFGATSQKNIKTEIRANLIFEDNSLKPTEISLKTELKFGEIAIHCDNLLQMPEEKLTEYAFSKIDQKWFEYDSVHQVFKSKR